MVPIGGYFVAAALSTFTAAALANALALRVWERAPLAAVGLSWTRASGRNLALGFAGGVGASVVVLGLPLLVGAAEFQKLPEGSFRWPSLLFVAVVLLFGAVGEELLFRGYGFQLLLGRIGEFATILPSAVLFGLAHSNNQHVSWLGMMNTSLWGVLFGLAFLRSRDLWLPIGLHFGWNLALPLFGVNLSGFTMNVTGYAIEWKIGRLWSGGDYGPEAGLLCTMVLGGLFYALQKAPVEKQTSLLYQPGDEEVEDASGCPQHRVDLDQPLTGRPQTDR
ncbi:MAG: CPBP family intramembrane metalloprotease [Bryobacteraceae bacterium]|nr:CPBP family intramembrane metalloprotease [Bryobacteraceae bacterium]MDW8380242.1 CPBP family intramembrane glutamic endopeptidase [Bryobacterales bacterium]